MLKKPILFLIVILIPALSYSQKTELIWEPALSYSWEISEQWSYTAKLSNFISLRELNNRAAIDYIETQLSATYTLSGGNKITGGYYYKWSSPLVEGYNYEHRILQQIGFNSKVGQQKLSHRLRAGQRIRSSSYQNRLRYRLKLKIPLQGAKVDEGEEYLITSDEIMTGFNRNAAAAENRFTLGLGWFFNSSRQFETGFQYRTQNIFGDTEITHLLLFFTSFSFSH